ncbi:MAG: type II secretion system F family protein [Candidatus Pacearchaeota archaeon]
MNSEDISKISDIIALEKKIAKEINSLTNIPQDSDDEDKKMIARQVNILKNSLRETNNNLLSSLENLNFEKSLKEIPKAEIQLMQTPSPDKFISGKDSFKKIKREKITELDKEVLKRLKKKEKEEQGRKEIKPSSYVKFANRLFSLRVRESIKNKKFVTLEKDLIKSNLGYTPVSYISILILTMIISFSISLVIFLFFLFFDIGTGITLMEEDIILRFLKVFWILILIPVVTLLFMYFYPSLERKSLEDKLNAELPFATIHMAAISGSHIEPTKIFRIVALTKEYPHLEKEFNKLLNEINVYGYDLVTALKDSAINSPSQKLADLFNGLATTITSGGDLYDFFDKRAQTLLFEYRLDREKQTKSAETFMDIYISVVIAAPMILMLLLMMMKISGLGVAISTSTLTFLVVGGVSMINIFFLVFLQIKQPAGGNK